VQRGLIKAASDGSDAVNPGRKLVGIMSELRNSESASTTASPRLVSLDQFRGYTMLGMLLVNFCGGFDVCPQILKHSHDYCSYADTIMPQFLFAVGFSMRLSPGRRWEREGRLPWGRVIRRIGGLALIAVLWYSLWDYRSVCVAFQTRSFPVVLGELAKRTWFQTLMHIAATSLWILPVIRYSPRLRILFLLVSAGLHVGVSGWFNFEWANTSPKGIDGGPLGFLSWAVPAILGSVTCDLVSQDGRAVRKLLGYGVIISLVGWLISFPSVLYSVDEPSAAISGDQNLAKDPVFPDVSRYKNWQGQMMEAPFIRPPSSTRRQWNYWMMTQRAASISYTTFAAGVSMVLFGIFHLLCDRLRLQAGVFRTLGTNSLAAYCLHDVASWIISPLIADAAAAGSVALVFVVYATSVWGACRILESRRWYVRV
jgi:predicted acyltransferase